ncbi:MAG: sigma-70 family RNA polymerase sigma factor [Spirochaetes bacterium]|nr:sigma-70 family RNA polymerase sigma factor [Spirochaetota bacterium]
MNAKKEKNRLSEFFRTEYSKLIRFIRRFIDDTAQIDSEDIIQEVMLNIFDTADITAPIENLSAYIYRAIHNKIIDIFRKNKNEISFDDQLCQENSLSLSDILYDIRYDTVKMLEEREVYNKMYKAIESLDPNEKAIIILTEFESRSFRELSEEWGIPIGTLLARKSRALKKIKNKLIRV